MRWRLTSRRFEIFYSSVCSCAVQRKHQSSEPLAFVWGIHRSAVNSPHKRASGAEKVSIWWRHHETLLFSASTSQQQDKWSGSTPFDAAQSSATSTRRWWEWPQSALTANKSASSAKMTVLQMTVRSRSTRSISRKGQHYSDVTGTLWRLKSPAIFVQQFVQVHKIYQCSTLPSLCEGNLLWLYGTKNLQYSLRNHWRISRHHHFT